MEFQPMDPGGGSTDFLTSIVVLIGLASTVFWMVVGWRAMRAHEQLAKSTAKLAASGGRRGGLDYPGTARLDFPSGFQSTLERAVLDEPLFVVHGSFSI